MAAFALAVQMPRRSRGRQALCIISRTVTRNAFAGAKIIQALDLIEETDFVMASREINAVQIDPAKIRSARLSSPEKTVNGNDIDANLDLSIAFEALINTQRELNDSQDAPVKVFLEIL